MTMEDVWKDISLASLCDHNSPAAAGGSATSKGPAAVRGFIFQDFMASAASTRLGASSLATDLAPPPPPPPLPLATLLSLSSSGSDQFQQYQVQSTTATTTSAPPVKLNPKRLQGSNPSSSLISFSNKSEAMASSYQYCKKRAIEELGENSKYVRHKRMIKNRESASRSRARKQAYTGELELKVEHLQEENARLRRNLEKIEAAVAARATTPERAATTLKRAHSI